MTFRLRLFTSPFARLALVALTVIALSLFALVVFGGAARGAAAASPPVGLPHAGQTAYEFVGRIDQDGDNFSSYGYLTYINGLDPAQLFSGPTHSEANAHFTYYATASLTSRSVISNVFVLNGTAPLITIYYNSYPSANFSNPASFAVGVPIATYQGRYQDVLNVQGPGAGIASNVGELRQLSVTPFTIGANSYQLGEVGLEQREWFTGEGTLTNPAIPRSFIVGAGNVVVTGRAPLYLPLAGK
jgi:hypothetical protein